MSRSLLLVVMLLGFAGAAQPAPPNNKPDATLRSTPETVVWGYFAADIPPALRIKSGQTVRIDTVSHGGLNVPGVDPVTYFGRNGIAAEEVLKDAIDIYQKVNRPRGASAHVLTGPIYIEEAEPGDMLEVRILALEHRVPSQETVNFLRERKGLSTADAYALASIAVDFRIAEVVDAVQMVYGAIPKKIFKTNPEYWLRK